MVDRRGFAEEVALLNQRQELADLPLVPPNGRVSLQEVPRLMGARRKAYDYLFLALAQRCGLHAAELQPEMDSAWEAVSLPEAKPGIRLSPVLVQVAVRRKWAGYKEALLQVAQRYDRGATQ